MMNNMATQSVDWPSFQLGPFEGEAMGEGVHVAPRSSTKMQIAPTRLASMVGMNGGAIRAIQSRHVALLSAQQQGRGVILAPPSVRHVNYSKYLCNCSRPA